MQNTAEQNYPGLIAFNDTRPGNEVGLFYNATKPTWGMLNFIIIVFPKQRHCMKHQSSSLAT